MQDELELLLRLVRGIPVWSVYVLLAAGAATENILPPVPSDTFVLLGAVLADQGILRLDVVFLVSWSGNVVLALFVYAMARKYGRAIFETRWGHWLLRPHQLRRLGDFYDRYGTVTVFASRFVPVFRVVVPAFAGISRLGVWRTVIPLAFASAAWYAALLGAGVLASRNLPRLVRLIGPVRGGLWAVALLALALVLLWWWRGREEGPDVEGDG